MTDEQADKIIGLLGVIAERLAHPMVSVMQQPLHNLGQQPLFCNSSMTNAKDHQP